MSAFISSASGHGGMVPHALEAQLHVLAMTARNGSHRKVLG